MKNFIFCIFTLPLLCVSCYYKDGDTIPSYPNSEPHDEYKSVLYYTTTNGEPLVLNNTKTFGIDILETTYTDGQGVITFNGIVRRIGAKSFQDCENLKTVMLPDSTRIIDHRAFANCTNLEEVIMNDSLMYIRDQAFVNCTSLASITIPRRVKEVADNVFLLCHNLEEFKGEHTSNDRRAIIIDGTMVAFAQGGIDEYVLPDNVIAIGNWVFNQCVNLRTVTLPSSIQSIGTGAFYLCTALEEIVLGEGVTYIGNEALGDCNALHSVYVKAVNPPIINLSSISIFNYDTYSYEYLGCDIYVPEETVDAYKSAEQWCEYAEYIKGYNFND